MSYRPERVNLHQKVLDAVYAHVLRDSKWPRTRLLEIELATFLPPGVGWFEVIHEIGNEFILSAPPEGDGTCMLTLGGVARCTRAELDVQRVLYIAGNAAAAYHESGGDGTAVLNLGDLFKAEALDSPSMSRLMMILESMEWLSPAGFPVYKVLRGAMTLGGVKSVDELAARTRDYKRGVERDKRLAYSSINGAAAPPHILFVSHAAVDLEIADLLAAHLEVALPMTAVFVASRRDAIVSGEEWLDLIRAKLRQADAFVVLWTHRSAERPWLWLETGGAWVKDNPRLIPATAGGFAKSKIPLPILLSQARALEDPQDAAQLFRDLGGELKDPAAFSAAIAEAAQRIK